MKKRLPLFILVSVFLIQSCSQSDNPEPFQQASKHIRNYPKKEISITDPIEIQLKDKLPQYTTDQVLPQDFFKISPSEKGQWSIENGNRLVFRPKDRLQPNTTYGVSIALGEFIENLPPEEQLFEFKVKTITPDFRVNINSLQSYDEKWQYILAEVEASDVLDIEQLKESISAQQNDKNLTIQFISKTDANYFEFKIDSILREKKDSEVMISWDGEPVQSETSGSESFKIPGQDSFSLLDIRIARTNPPHVLLNFSESLEPDQNFIGLVQIDQTTDFRFEVNGNVLKVIPKTKFTGQVNLQVFEGIKSQYGGKLTKVYTESIRFKQLKPAVRLISKGVILPNSATNPFYFETVNLAAVDVRLIQIFESNILQFLQQQNITSTNTYNLRDVGRLVAKKTIPIQTTEFKSTEEWQAQAIDLSSIFEISPGSLYQIELSFRKAYSYYDCGENTKVNTKAIDEIAEEFEDESEDDYWDKNTWSFRDRNYDWRERNNPCDDSYYNEDHFVRSNILASDLGLIVKKTGNETYFLASTNLVNGQPQPRTTITLFNEQQQPIQSFTTGDSGIAQEKIDRSAAFAIAKKDKHFAYLKLNNSNALNVSNFEVEGQKIKQGINGFLYTDRGVYRPGDDIFFNFVLDDFANPLPKNHPVKVSFFDPNGRLTHTEVKNSSVHNFYNFPLSTEIEDPTGNWRIVVNVGAVEFTKYIPIATVKPNRLKIELSTTNVPQLIQNNMALDLYTQWLTGATAKGLKAEVKAKLRSSDYRFDGFKKFTFQDPVRNFYPLEYTIFDGTVNSEGRANFSKDINFPKHPPGMVKADFLSKVFEGGGDFSIDVNEQWYAPFTHFVGLKASTPNQNSRFETGQPTKFEVVSVNHKGEIAAQRQLKVYVHKIEWRWWWNQGHDNLSRYEDATVHRPYMQANITTDNKGKAQFSFKIPEDERGRYLVRVIDKKSQHATGEIVYFFKNWWSMQGNSKENQLVFTTDKDTYKVGEQAKINFPSMADAKALLTIENGSEILTHEWIDAQKGMTEFSMEVTEDMAPNAYVSISLIQAHQNTKNDLPIRLFGVVPIEVENPKRKLEPILELPESIRPEENYSLKVSEKNGEAMVYTIAVVDEGLLDLTSFKTPDIYEYFNAKQSLGVRTFDVFDDVIGAYGGSIRNIYSIGGGDEAAGKKNRKAERFKPVVSHLGPFYLEAGESKTHKLYMPNYIGSVKAMLVTGNPSKQSYNSMSKIMKVKQPLMMLTSVPRKLSPGETLKVPVTIFVMDDALNTVEVEVTTHDQLQLIGESKQQIQVDDVGEYMVYFDFKVPETLSVQKLNFQAKANGEKASSEVEVDVINPNPISSKNQELELKSGKSGNLSLEAFGSPGTNALSLSFSAYPPMNLEKRMHYLTSYPHGCVEQVTSKAFPQLFLKGIIDLDSNQKNQLDTQVKSAISKLSRYQTTSGGMAYWLGGDANEWATNYVGHFMLEAKTKSYQLPFGFLSNWKQFQKKKARSWSPSYQSYDLVQAYRLYTLALLGEPEVASMNRLKNMSELSPAAASRLALAYAIIGQASVAKSLIKNLDLGNVEEIRFQTFGSKLRNLAMLLETYVYLNDSRMNETARDIAAKLSSDDWLHTHETAYALLAMSKYIEAKGGKDINLTYKIGNKTYKVKSSKGITTKEIPIEAQEILSLSVTNLKDGDVFVNALQSGQLPLGEELAASRNLELQTQFLDANNEVIAVESIRQGSEITIQLQVTNLSNSDLKEVALSQFIPSGWEIIDTQYTTYKSGDFANANHVDLRDDRVYIYFDLPARKRTQFEIKVNASYLGEYYLPGTQVEAMYKTDHFARNQGQWIQVEE